MSVLLKVDNVSKAYGGVVANRQVFLELRAGDIAGLIGPHRPGKTTRFTCIGGAPTISSGSIQFDGRDISHPDVSPHSWLGRL